MSELASVGGLQVQIGEFNVNDSGILGGIVNDEEDAAVTQRHGNREVLAFEIEEIAKTDLVVLLLELLV